MHILNDIEIDTICRKIVDTAKTEYPIYYPHILALYNTGCRIGEVFGNRMYYDSSTDTVHIIAQKKNYIRKVNEIGSLDISTINRLSKRQDLFYLNVRNLQRVLKKLIPVSNIKCGKKNIGAHIFRHNYIRKLFAQGKTIEEIDRHLGYTSQTVENTYLSAVIYY